MVEEKRKEKSRNRHERNAKWRNMTFIFDITFLAIWAIRSRLFKSPESLRYALTRKEGSLSGRVPHVTIEHLLTYLQKYALRTMYVSP